MAKPTYGSGIDKKTYDASIQIFEKILKVLHPFMPFLTEEIWQLISNREAGKGSICIAPWPVADAIDKNLLAQLTPLPKL